MTGCKVEGCESKLKGGYGYCSMHYQRIKYRGSLEQPIATASDAERFWAQVAQASDPDACWPWVGSVSATYGRIMWNGRGECAHRVAYILEKGHIPDGLVIDHICNVRLCVNPRHLRPVTIGENNARSSSPSAINAMKTHCKHGHEFTAENTYHRPDRPQHRDCRRCRVAAGQRASAR